MTRIYKFDLKTIHDLLSTRNSSYCLKAVVLGVKMKTRGPSYRFNNENNNLTKNWIKPVQYSSWCMFEKRKYQKDKLLVL